MVAHPKLMCAQLIYPAQNWVSRPPLVLFFFSILFWLHEYDYITKRHSSPRRFLTGRGVPALRQEPRLNLSESEKEDILTAAQCRRFEQLNRDPGTDVKKLETELSKMPPPTRRGRDATSTQCSVMTSSEGAILQGLRAQRERHGLPR